jgi:lysyl-tRNA synthetase class II
MTRKIKLLFLIAVAALGLSVSAVVPEKTTPKPAVPAAVQPERTYTKANALDIVARPNYYLNKYVSVKGRFDKFSTLGLDYKPALRSSEDYISFLIQRDDIRDHNIPLSEMKIFIPRKEAEKHIDLNAGDEIEFSGKVFSTALGDAWFDVEKFTVLSAKKKEGK